MTADVESASPERKQKRTRSAGSDKATIAKVSQAAGVSTATVSRMLNTPDLVSPNTRRTIQRELDRLAYAPSGAARVLRRQEARTVGAIIPSIKNGLSARVLDGFQRVIARAGYDLLLASFEEDPLAVRHLAENFVRRDVDALFIVSAQHDDALYDFLRSRKVPFVTTWPAATRRAVPFVAYDHEAAALKPVKYLLDLGHREMALITGRLTGNRRLRERHDSVRQLLTERGIDLPDDRVIDVGSYDLASARQAFRLLRSRGPLPTAIIASNDIIAGGVALECHAAQIAVPGDLSVTGFGDLDIAAQLSPSLTTVQTPRVELGQLAAEYLVRRLCGHDVIDQTRLDVRLIIRESTGKPRA